LVISYLVYASYAIAKSCPLAYYVRSSQQRVQHTQKLSIKMKFKQIILDFVVIWLVWSNLLLITNRNW